MNIRPARIRYYSLALALMSALPLPIGLFTGFYLWLSPLILAGSVLALKTLSLFNILAGIVAVISIFNKRWFCRFLCPVGALCDLTSGLSLKSGHVTKLPAINRIATVVIVIFALCGIPLLALLDPINAFYNFFSILHAELSILLLVNISGLLFILLVNYLSPFSWCRKLCPLGGIQLLLNDLGRITWGRKKLRDISFRPDRRHVLAGISGGIFGMFFHLARGNEGAGKNLFRPPGALPENRFSSVCIRCGNCSRACPTGIIRLTNGSAGLFKMMTPRLDFSDSYCLPDCTRCGDVCPSGAIAGFDLEEKKQLLIGTISVDPDKCLLTHNKECNQCQLSCPYDAIKITFDEDSLTPFPTVIPNSCTGCGACKIICPPEAIAIRPLEKTDSRRI